MKPLKAILCALCFCCPVLFSSDAFDPFDPKEKQRVAKELYAESMKLSGDFHVAQYKLYTKGEKSSPEEVDVLAAVMKRIAILRTRMLQATNGWNPPSYWKESQKQAELIRFKICTDRLEALPDLNLAPPFSRENINQARMTLDAACAMTAFLGY